MQDYFLQDFKISVYLCILISPGLSGTCDKCEHLPSAFSLQVYFLDFPTVERIPKNPVNTSIEPNSLD